MKYEKGFIQIPILIIIISIITASAGAGVVLHKQGKLSSITADIVGVFDKTEEIIIVKDKEIKEELQNEQEPKLEDELMEEEVVKQEIDEDEIVQHSQKLAEEPESELEVQPIWKEIAELEFIPKIEEAETTPEVEESIKSNSCTDINCPNCQYCDYGICVNYCQGIDSNCGCGDCVNCNNLDGCSENNYLDYSCSNTSCVFDSDDCSDCSCSCGGYNIEESIANGNCEDGKDNDCDGNIDSIDFGCESFQLSEQDIEYSISPKEIQTSIRTNFVCSFKILKPNFDYSEIKALYFRFYNEEDDGHFSFSAGIGSSDWENNQGEFTFSIVVSHNNNPRIWRLLSIAYEIKYSNMYSIPISNGIELIR